MMVNAIVPPLDFSQQREIVVKYKPIIVLTVFGTWILDARCFITKSQRREAVEKLSSRSSRTSDRS